MFRVISVDLIGHQGSALLLKEDRAKDLADLLLARLDLKAEFQEAHAGGEDRDG
jgi:hypothetical protein